MIINKKSEVLVHFIFLFIISLFYSIPYFFIGQLILNPHDLMDMGIVENYISGKIYRGDFESINLFLAGEFKWYNIKRILQPLMTLYALFDAEVAYWIIDIFFKLVFYISFFKLSKKLKCSAFNSALIACLMVSLLTNVDTVIGLGLASFPYLTYLIIKNKSLKIRHYFFIIFIGLNFDLVFHMYLIPTLLILSMILSSNYQNYNFKLYFKIVFLLSFFIILSNLNLFYSYFFGEESHRSEYIIEASSGYNTKDGVLLYFFHYIKNFLRIPYITDYTLFFYQFFKDLILFFIITISFFSKNKKVYNILLVIFLITTIDLIFNLNFFIDLRNSSEGIFKIMRWEFLYNVLPVAYGMLLIVSIGFIIKKTKYLFYPFIFLVMITIQVNTSIIPISKYFLSFDNLSAEQKNKIHLTFHAKEFILLFKEIAKLKENDLQRSRKNFKTKYTFNGYYDYENYRYIKSLVGNSRTISIGLEPMVAVMNDIKVIDGYHSIYPLRYKKKFRKVIENQLNESDNIKKYFDEFGNKVQTLVVSEKSIKTNFVEAQKLGADYVISKYSISSDNLLLVCKKCNNSPELYLYKIKT